eukprot:4888017-Pleurochrysis_carterae.AAC.1
MAHIVATAGDSSVGDGRGAAQLRAAVRRDGRTARSASGATLGCASQRTRVEVDGARRQSCVLASQESA